MFTMHRSVAGLRRTFMGTSTAAAAIGGAAAAAAAFALGKFAIEVENRGCDDADSDERIQKTHTVLLSETG
jgi:hypothetical protein